MTRKNAPGIVEIAGFVGLSIAIMVNSHRLGNLREKVDKEVVRLDKAQRELKAEFIFLRDKNDLAVQSINEDLMTSNHRKTEHIVSVLQRLTKIEESLNKLRKE